MVQIHILHIYLCPLRFSTDCAVFFIDLTHLFFICQILSTFHRLKITHLSSTLVLNQSKSIPYSFLFNLSVF